MSMHKATQVMTTQEIEKHIVDMLLIRAIGQGYSVSVNDGEDLVLSKSQHMDDILKAMFSTDEDVLIFHHDDKRLGSMWLIYGNGADVISDHSFNPEMSALADEAQELSGYVD